MAAHIHWHEIEAGHEIGAVVEVESTQEVLVGLAAATVQGDHHTGHGFKDFTGSDYLAAAAYYFNFLNDNLMSIQDGVTTRCENCSQRASVG